MRFAHAPRLSIAVLFAALTALVGGTPALAQTHAAAGSLRLVALVPNGVEVGHQFNYQPGAKESALAVKAQNAPPGTSIVFDGHVLKTTRGNNGILTAGVPSDLVSKPGRYTVYLKFGSSTSNQLSFMVFPHLVLVRLVPNSVKMGQRFNYQPGSKQSALIVVGRNVEPSTVIVFDGHVLPTTVQGRRLIAPVSRLITKPGRYAVYLKYGSLVSNSGTFVVT